MIYTPRDILAFARFGQARKTGVTWIRPVMPADVEYYRGARDLEDKPLRAELGRLLCIGVEGEIWTCRPEALIGRVVSGIPNAAFFIPYVIANPKTAHFAYVDHFFWLQNTPNGDRWKSQPDGAMVVWDSSPEKMRLIKKSIFEKTYTVDVWPE